MAGVVEFVQSGVDFCVGGVVATLVVAVLHVLPLYKVNPGEGCRGFGFLLVVVMNP